MLHGRSKLAGFQRCVIIRSLLFSDKQRLLFTGVCYAIVSSFVYDVSADVCVYICSVNRVPEELDSQMLHFFIKTIN